MPNQTAYINLILKQVCMVNSVRIFQAHKVADQKPFRNFS